MSTEYYVLNDGSYLLVPSGVATYRVETKTVSEYPFSGRNLKDEILRLKLLVGVLETYDR